MKNEDPHIMKKFWRLPKAVNGKLILVCGLGSIGKRHIENLISLGISPSNIIIFRTGKGTVTFGDAFLKREPRIRVINSLEKALALKPFITLITNPTALHLDTATRAAKAGSHLFIEKPLGINLNKAKNLSRLCRRKQLIACVGYNLRFHPLLRLMKSIIKEGKIGLPVYVEAEHAEYLPDWHPWENYRVSYASQDKLGGGSILTQSHEADALYWLFGKPNTIYTAGGTSDGLPMNVENIAECILQYKHKKIIAALHLDYFKSPPVRFLEVTGTKGRLKFDYITGTLSYIPLAGKQHVFHQPKNFFRNDMFLDEIKHLITCAARGVEPMNNLTEAAEVLEILLAMKRSLSTHKATNL